MDLFSNKGRVLNIKLTGGSGGTSGERTYNMTLSGIKNGTNRVFTTDDDFTPNSTQVYLNGQRMYIGASEDYTETDTNEITFNVGTVIISTDRLMADYEILVP